MYNQFRPGVMATEAMLLDTQLRSAAFEALLRDADARKGSSDRSGTWTVRTGRDHARMRMAKAR